MPESVGVAFTRRAEASRTRWNLGADEARWLGLWSLATALVLFVLSQPASLHQDDLLNLQLHRAAESPLDMLLAPVFLTQIAPGFQALTAFQLWFGPTDRIVIHALMAGLGGASVWVAGQIGRRSGVRSRLLPVALALVIAGPGGLAVVLWYSAAYHFMPSMFFGLVAVLLFLRWRRSTDGPLPRGAPVLSVLAVGVGLLFSLKAGISVLFILLLEYVLLRRGDLETLILGMWRDRRVWLSYGLLLVLYLAVSRRAGLDPPLGDATTIAAAVVRGLVRMTSPMFVGLGSAELDYTPPQFPAWMFILSWIAVATAALLIARRGPLAQRGLAVGGVMLVTGLVVTAGPRTTFLAEAAALAPRYHLEGMVYTVLAVSIALTMQRTSSPTRAQAATRAQTLNSVVTVAVILAIAAATAWSHAQRLETAPSILSGAYLERLEDALDDPQTPRRVLDTNVPWFLIEVVPGSRMELLDGLVPRLDIVRTDPDAVVTPEGDLERLSASELFAESGSQFAVNALVVFEGEPIVLGDELCAPDELRFTLPVAPNPRPRLVAIEPGTDLTAEIRYSPIQGRAPEPTARAAGGPGGGELVLPLDLVGWVQSVEISMRSEDDGLTCLKSVRILELHNEVPVPRVDQQVNREP